MSDYIKREALLEDLTRAGLQSEFLKFKIEKFPAADVAPVRHGRWEPGNPICPVCGENKFKDLDADVWADWQPKFCPNCGARMGKGDEHDKHSSNPV